MRGRQLNVLIVDDDEEDAYLACEAIRDIEASDYVLHTATTPQEAFEMVKAGAIDIVLCDYLMGAKSGLDFIEMLRADGVDVPVILLTGMGDRTMDDAALKAGAADFISKTSISPEILDRAIRYSLANAERQRLLQTILKNVNAAVVFIDNNGTPTLWNPMFLELVKITMESTEPPSLVAFCENILSEDKLLSIGTRILEKKVSRLVNNESVVMLQDVTDHIKALRERERANDRAKHLAMHCSLTELPNRHAFNDRLNDEIEYARRTGYGFRLFLLDLNKFKEINDMYGHKVGDLLLAEVGRRMSGCLRGDEYLARLGGDEFVAIQRWTRVDSDAAELAHRIVEVVNGSYQLGDTMVNTSVSIGIANYPEHGNSAEELMSNADVAMYRAKAHPVCHVSFFDADMDKIVRETRQLARDLKTALENKDLDVYFQPQANVSDYSVVGFEALARWHHAEFGQVSPARFIPIAEDTGLINDIGELILTNACDIAARWAEPLNIAVNISPLQIRYSDLDQLVHSVLMKTGLPAQRLELEVTESVLIDDLDRALHILRKIKNLGVSIALDDFGTGFSSLSTLISFPFDKIKIDRSFTACIENSAKATEAMRAMVGLGHNLNHTIIAEGVEKRRHVEFLTELKCHEMQGYLIGAPSPHKTLEHLTNPASVTTQLVSAG